MGLLRIAALAAIFGIAIRFILSLRPQFPPPNFGGFVQPGFEAVEQAFRYALAWFAF